MPNPSPIIAQLTDLHLPSGFAHTPNAARTLTRALARAQMLGASAFLLTGDLINNGTTADYDALFGSLKQTGKPFFALAGNHDVSFEHNAHLPYDKRFLTPPLAANLPDKRLISNAVLPFSGFNLIILDSTVLGKEHGFLTDNTLDFLARTLTQNLKIPTIIALHHPPVTVGSAWIDALGLKNPQALASVVQSLSNVTAIVAGHVHQATILPFAGTQVYTAPALSRQFLPNSDAFALDNKAAGFALFGVKYGKFWQQVVRL